MIYANISVLIYGCHGVCACTVLYCAAQQVQLKQVSLSERVTELDSEAGELRDHVHRLEEEKGDVQTLLHEVKQQSRRMEKEAVEREVSYVDPITGGGMQSLALPLLVSSTHTHIYVYITWVNIHCLFTRV